MRGALSRTFRSLRVHNYRLYFCAQLVSMSGTWMQSVAQNWLVLELTGSGVALGVTVGLQFGPVLVLGAYGGVLADRVDKRRLMVVTQTVAALLALTLGLLTAFDVVQVWMVWALAALTGVAVSLDLPARQSFVAEMVPVDDLANAIGLNSVIINASRIAGPALGGVLLVSVGVAACFLVNAASFSIVIAALLAMRTGELRAAPPQPRRAGQLREGLRYVWRTPALRMPLVMMAVVSTLGYNFSVLLPLLAKYSYGRGGGAYGALSTAMGIGALAGALLMASRRRPTRRLLAASTLAFGAFTLAVAAAPGFSAGLVLLVPMGAAAVLFVSATNALLQLNADAIMRGRVMALWSVVFLGSTPIGGPLAGALARGLGARGAVAVAGVATLAVAAAALPALRRRPLAAGTCEVAACLPGDAEELLPRAEQGVPGVS
jgi:MFS family permease